MTFINAQRGKVYFDTTGCNPDGKIAAFVAKAVPLVHQGAILVCAGSTQLGAIAAPILSEASNANDMRRLAVTKLHDFVPQAERHLGTDCAGVLVVVTAADAWIMYTGGIAGGFQPWKIHDIGAGRFVTPSTPLMDAEFPDVQLTDARAVALAEQARRVTGHGKPYASIVGGCLVAASIGADGINMRVLRRWSDEIGKPISP
jgi:hypothetical protein